MVEQFAVGSGQGAVGKEQLAAGNCGYEFKIFCGNKDMDDSLLQEVVFDKWVNYNAHTKVWYSSTGNILPVLQQEIKTEKPDHLFIVGTYDWKFNFKPLLFCKGVKKIISVRGMLHPGALSQKSFKKKIYLQLWKLLGLHKQHVFHASDAEEQKYIQQVFGADAKVLVAANFPGVLHVQPVVKKELGYLKLVSIALISPMKNILLVLEALAKSCELLAVSGEEESLNGKQSKIANLKSKIFSIEYTIYGPVKDKKYWQECAALIKKMPANIKVNYHGDIAPEKIEDALAGNHVFILPSKSENFGHAIYEALSAGRPVITSNTTPWNNLEAAKAGKNITLTDTQEMVKAIGFFAGMGQEEIEEWSRGARVYAEGAVDVEAIRRQYEEMFR